MGTASYQKKMNKQCQIKTKVTREVPEPVVISDNNDDIQAVGDIQPLGLSSHDLQILEKNSGTAAWLNDQLINAGQQLIRKQFPSIGGLQHPILSETLTFDIQKGPFVQIVNCSRNHWICLSSFGCPSNNVSIFDSLRSSCPKLGKDVEEIVASILFTESASINFMLPQVQRQRTGINCGLLP